ncbi:MAG: hypothetical protein ACOC1U_05230 [Spirochaetota bacterium]
MSAFTDKRTSVERKIVELSRTLHKDLAEAGRRLVESGLLPSEEPYASLTRRERELSDEIEERTRTRDRIVAIGERLAEIETKRKELEDRIKEIGTGLEPHYRVIGENAFRVFRDNPLIDQEYADIFTPLLDANEEMRQMRSELTSAEGELAEKPFLEKMVLRGRIIVLRNRLALRENQIERLYRDAGKQISATDFITTIGDPELDEAAAPLLELIDESNRLEGEVTALGEERDALQRELSKLGVERRPASRINQLKEEIGALQEERRGAHAEIAMAAKGSDLLEQADAETKELLRSIAATENEKRAAEERIGRLDAAIRAERLAGDIDQIETSIGRKRSQIATLTGDIEELERKRAGLETQIREEERARGPVEELLE